ncbi:trihelix transcription factor GTL1-like [Oryza brachyantha]|uniref:trihelix transcription factor GTL1-like n=1 Tax=Oryza brachyantha TaxID=4533 RepID=UPI001AD95E35|nr:trihelix transcription factor GTL1-like [Oryza brachyantha]
MQQQQQPGMPPFSAAGEAASPISSRPPAAQQQVEEQLGGANGPGSGSSLDHDGLAGEDGDRGGSSAGNRWPRQETLALLKIRSEMDAAFREAALKGPLWEEVSRKLAEMGYTRSAKKCREKFENVDKYYKRTKDGRAGRGDGKAYRFFTELEALHGAAASSRHQQQPPPAVSLAPAPVAVAPPATPVGGGSGGLSALRVPVAAPPPVVLQPAPRVTTYSTAPVAGHAMDAAACVMTMDDVSFSSGSDTEETAEEGGKRKRRSSGGKAMRMFEGLMRQVMERQEAMQQRLLEAIERRDQERMIREEAWRRQEVARLAREQDALAQERAIAASRDAAVISFIQRVTGQSIAVPPPLQPTPVASAAPAPAPPQHQHQQPPPQPVQPHIMPMTPQPQPQLQPQPQSKELTAVRAPPELHDMAASGGGGASSSRWPKAEVHALIQLRTELEARYQDAGPKGPLWEDISAGMRRLGYSRSSKRCKEKWENINKYFKKVKESNKKRPEDSKTCPYYHQLEALYRSKANAASPAAGAGAAPPVTVLAAVPLSQTAPQPHVEHGSNGANGNGWASRAAASANNGGSSGGMQTKASNGTAAAGFPVVEGAGAGGNGVASDNKGSKQESVVKETAAAAAEQRQPQPLAMNHNYGNDRMADDMDSDSMDEDDDEFDDDDEDDDIGSGKMQMQYETSSHFQRPQMQQNQTVVVRPNGGGGGGGAPTPPPAGPPPPAATSGTSFLACVQ